MIDTILNRARDLGASDVHLNTNNPPIFRIDGEIRRVNSNNLSTSELNHLVRNVLGENERKAYLAGIDVDTSYSDPNGFRYRINAYRGMGEPALAIRLLDNEIPTINGLNLPEILKDLANLPRGIILVTGPTGSGKTTTLAAIIDYINTRRKKHILTLEDPIEYIHEQKMSIVTQREIFKDTESLNSSLRSALREDPDVILVGEMRDAETIQLAMTAAETGHLVLSTLHTIGAPDTINRIVDSFPPGQQNQIRSQLSTTLKAVISQLLIPKVGGGRIATHEIMIMTDAIANNIRQSTVYNIISIILANEPIGMQLLDVELSRLSRKRIIDKNVALEMAKDKDQYRRFLRS